jgi:hypothetical protein
MSRSIDTKSRMFLRCRRKNSRLNAEQLIELWKISDCKCTKGSTNADCPLNKILYTMRRQRSFRTFKKVVKGVGSIARSQPEKQKRKNHLRYISKCRSGPFYTRMDYLESKEIRENPALYNDSDSLAIGEKPEDSATEEMHSDNNSAEEI